MTKNQILALEQHRFKAMCAADAGALNELLHRDLKYTHSSGAVDSKESYVRGVREKRWDYQSVKPSNEAVAVYGNTAVVHCHLRIDVKVGGAPKVVNSVALTVWVEDQGRWQVVAVHSTPQPA